MALSMMSKEKKLCVKAGIAQSSMCVFRNLV
jgi:hypothetical protein